MTLLPALAIICLVVALSMCLLNMQPKPTKPKQIQVIDNTAKCVSNPTLNSWVLARSKPGDNNVNQCASNDGTTCLQFDKASCQASKTATFWVDCQNQDFCRYDLSLPDSELYISNQGTYPCWSAQTIALSENDKTSRQVTSVGQNKPESLTCDFVKPSVGGMKDEGSLIVKTNKFNLFPKTYTQWTDRSEKVHHNQRHTATYAPGMFSYSRVVKDWPCSFTDGKNQYVGRYEPSDDTCVSTNGTQILRSNQFSFLANSSSNNDILMPKIDLTMSDVKWSESIMSKTEWVQFIQQIWKESYAVLYPNNTYPGPKRDVLVVFIGDTSPYSSVNGTVCAQCSPVSSTTVVLHLYKECFNGIPSKQILGTLISHEVTHGFQWFRDKQQPELTEGISEYVRMSCGHYMPADYKSMNKTSRCPDWSSYSCNGAFLHYIENTYDKNLVKDLNREFYYESKPWTLENVKPKFVEKTGKTATDLWKEFMQQLPDYGPLYPQSWLPKARSL
jgi:hypothetical protein